MTEKKQNSPTKKSGEFSAQPLATGPKRTSYEEKSASPKPTPTPKRDQSNTQPKPAPTPVKTKPLQDGG